MERILLWLLLAFRVLVADDSDSDSGDSDSGGSDSGGSDSGGSDASGSDSSILSSGDDDSGSDSGGRRRRRARNAMLVRQDGTPDPSALSPDDYRDIPTP